MFESALGNLCIVICGMTVLLSAFFIWRTETLPNRLIVAAAAALVLIFRWQISMMIYQSWRPSSRSSHCSWASCCSAPCPLCSSVSSCTEGGERMEYAFTLNVLPVVGGVVIVLVLVLCELGSTGFGGGLRRAATGITSESTPCCISGSPAHAAGPMCWRAKPRRRCRCTTPGAVLISRCGRPLRQRPSWRSNRLISGCRSLSSKGSRTTERNPLWQSSGNWSGGSRPWAQ